MLHSHQIPVIVLQSQGSYFGQILSVWFKVMVCIAVFTHIRPNLSHLENVCLQTHTTHTHTHSCLSNCTTCACYKTNVIHLLDIKLFYYYPQVGVLYVFMYVLYVFMCVYMCLYVFMYVLHVFMSVYICDYVCLYVFICVYVCLCMCLCVFM